MKSLFFYFNIIHTNCLIFIGNHFKNLSNPFKIHKRKDLGKLCFIACVIPGLGGLFSTLQHALLKAKGHRVCVTKHLQAHILDFAHLAASLCRWPTYLTELIPQQPMLLGATDAAKPSMGGVHFDPGVSTGRWPHCNVFHPDQVGTRWSLTA